jgi:hypothetical protein
MNIPIFLVLQSRAMRTIAYCFLALLAAIYPAQQPIPTFHAATRLVELTVTVLDSKGNPVTGLSSEEFAVEDGGKKRPIAFFSFEGAPELGTGRKLAPGTFTNNPEAAGGAPRNITALVLDSLNTPVQYAVQARGCQTGGHEEQSLSGSDFNCVGSWHCQGRL